MKKTYGDYILKLAIKDINKFMFFDFKEYKRLINPKANENNYIEEQLKKFGIEKYFQDKELNSRVDFCKTIEEKNLFNKVAGVIYNGKKMEIVLLFLTINLYILFL